MTTVKELLERKPRQVVNVEEDASVLDAAELMNQHRIGAVVVTRGEKVVGIFTERDVLNRVVAVRQDPAEVRVGDVMTAPVAVCVPETTADECRLVMRQKRIRHLPVVDGERLAGIVSIGDILLDHEHEQDETIRYLYEYLYVEWDDAKRP